MSRFKTNEERQRKIMTKKDAIKHRKLTSKLKSEQENKKEKDGV